MCTVGRGLDGARAVAVSGDRKNVYVASVEGDAVAIFRRDEVSGRLIQADDETGCISETGSEDCTDGKALDGATIYPHPRYSLLMYLLAGMTHSS